MLAKEFPVSFVRLSLALLILSIARHEAAAGLLLKMTDADQVSFDDLNPGWYIDLNAPEVLNIINLRRIMRRGQFIRVGLDEICAY